MIALYVKESLFVTGFVMLYVKEYQLSGASNTQVCHIEDSQQKCSFTALSLATFFILEIYNLLYMFLFILILDWWDVCKIVT